MILTATKECPSLDKFKAKAVNKTCLVRALRLSQLPVQEVCRLLDLADLLHEAVIDGVAAQLHVRPVRARLKPRLGDLRDAKIQT